MIHLKINRIHQKDGAMFGVMFDENDKYFSMTIEREWAGSIPFFSCIPTGVYLLKPVKSNRYGETWEYQNVKDNNGTNRPLCRIHWGSFGHNYQGCQGFGESLKYLKSKKLNKEILGLTKTKNTFKVFHNRYKGKELLITITESKKC
jgi:hypothetical protein